MLWGLKGNKVFLNINEVNIEEFSITSKNGFHLIHPKKNKWEWKEEEKWLRSVVVDDNGFIVSCAWKKFGNYGEFLNETEFLNNELQNNRQVYFTTKMDGSLCVRSVINGKVILRSRGTLFGGEAPEDGGLSFGERFKIVAESKYLKLLDPTWMPDVSLLLEYISPTNFVVIRYEQDDLIFLGGVKHNLYIMPWDEVCKIADDGKLNLVKLRELPRNPLLMLEEVKLWKEEGVVVRCCGDQIFVKVKSDWYKSNHALKSTLNYQVVVEFIEQSNVETEKQFEEFLHSFDYDFELIEYAIGFYKEYKKAEEYFNGLVSEAEKKFNSFNTDLLGIEKRKEYAKLACAQSPEVKTLMFALYDDNNEQINKVKGKVVRKCANVVLPIQKILEK